MRALNEIISQFPDIESSSFKKPGERSFNVILFLVIIFSFTSQYTFCQNTKEELNSTFTWFRNNPPKSDGSNFQSRREKTTLLDKYGWQLSNDTWTLYRSCWPGDPAKLSDLENSNPILGYLRQTVDKSVDEIKNTRITQGVIIWKLYNMGYVIKTKDACFAIDLVQPDSKRLVEILDFAIVSHAHADHFDKDFVKAMVERGKTVYSPFYEQGTVIKSTGEFNFKEVSLRFTMNMQGNIPVIVSQINCGPSAKNYTIYDIADARELATLNPTRHVNLFILHIANGLDIFDAVDQVKPDATIYDHIMEFGHPIGKYRWSYDFTYNKIERQNHASSYVLTWGEKLEIGVTPRTYSDMKNE